MRGIVFYFMNSLFRQYDLELIFEKDLKTRLLNRINVEPLNQSFEHFFEKKKKSKYVYIDLDKRTKFDINPKSRFSPLKRFQNLHYLMSERQ